MIEDGTPAHFEDKESEEFTEECKRTRAEQSDLIMILLNIAVIPDSCVRRIKNFEAGWQKDFYEIMEDYKKNEFEGRKYHEWEF